LINYIDEMLYIESNDKMIEEFGGTQISG